MANVSKLAPKILKWEGGDKYTEVRNDRGGATKYGITLNTLKALHYDKNYDGKVDKTDVKLLTEKDFEKIFKEKFWVKWKGDEIKNQSVANILVDWVWGSGKWGIIIPQRVLGVKADGVVGEKTIEALNKADQYKFFNIIWNERKKFFENIVKRDPSQKKFLKGWLNRLNDFKFEA